MKVVAKALQEVIIGRNEAGMFEFKDTNKSVEMGNTAFVTENENLFTGETSKLYFKHRENAEKFE